MKKYLEIDEKFHMPTYKRFPILVTRGRGMFLWDENGNKYLDFIAGLGVCNIGHCHPKLVKAVKKQLEKIIHTTNLFFTQPQIELIEKLSKISIKGKCFIANSGAEANEGAVKLTRKYFKYIRKEEEKFEIITANRSFHGRTLKMLAATGQPDKKEPFEPLPPGFRHVNLNDMDEMNKSISNKTCAIMLEPVQGEGGVYPCEKSYLKAIRKLCDEKGLLLIFDEVQTGFGRTGKMFAYENYEVEPDIITLAKGLGGGLPIGAFVAKNEIADAFEPGDHGSTFGGNPLVCSAANAAIDIIQEEDLLKNSAEMGSYFEKLLFELSGDIELIKEVR
ncbi:MAG: aspartate aminotransferase family protein, partial [Actinomycetia bacterium]|nr:aspartate aminotransferase family protein [Actinomycetes bacterium]